MKNLHKKIKHFILKLKINKNFKKIKIKKK